jgi:hypothetical protein
MDRRARGAAVKLRSLLRLLAAYALVLVLASAGLAAWLFLSVVPGPGGPGIASVWRRGARVARRVAGGDPRAAFASELSAPGTTLVVEHVVREGRVVTLGRRLFALSFLAGRDGVRATIDGKDAYLSPDDLVEARLYRGPSGKEGRSLDAGIDADGVLARLSRDLGCSEDRLWKSGRFRRFLVTRATSADSAEDKDGERQARRQTTPNGSRLAMAIKDAATHLAERVLADGRFAPSSNLTTNLPSAGYDWKAHAAATAFLADAGAQFASHQYKASSWRAGTLLRDTATSACGLNSCIGTGVRADTGLSAATLFAFSTIAVDRMGAPFRAAVKELSAFIREQQRVSGGFYAAYDRSRSQPIDEENADADVQAVLALARAYRSTKNPADLEAAREGVRYLTGSPGLIGTRNVLGADARICAAVEELWPKNTDFGALGFCADVTSWGTVLQLDRDTPVGEYRGGFRADLGWMPDLLFTAARIEGATATLATALRTGQSAERLRAVDLQVSSGLELLLREQFPGVRSYMLRDPKAMAGGFAKSPIDFESRLDATAAAGSAMLRCLRLLAARGLYKPPPPRRMADIEAAPLPGSRLPQ